MEEVAKNVAKSAQGLWEVSNNIERTQVSKPLATMGFETVPTRYYRTMLIV